MTLLQTATGFPPRTTNSPGGSMPLPTPHSGENEDDFIARCMKDPATQDITGDTTEHAQQRRLAACYRRGKGKHDEGELETKACGPLETKDEAGGEVTA